MCSTFQACTLTEEQIDGLEDADDGLDLLDDHNIKADGVTDLTGARKYLRQHLKEIIKRTFKCQNCQLTEDDLQDLPTYTIQSARKLLTSHTIPSEAVTTIDKAQELLENHLKDKIRLEPYDTAEVSVTVRELVQNHTNGRKHLLSRAKQINKYVQNMPEERMGDLKLQLPFLDEDLETINEQLDNDNCTLMVAGETGAGKSCLLNILLGELFDELLAVNNLPATSALCEVKYGKDACLKAYPMNGDEPVTVPLTKENAPQTIAAFTSKKGDRTDLHYSKVEVFWPCDWIKHGITITDTPGLGESEELTDMVKNYIPKASGFMYVINTTNAGGINPEENSNIKLTSRFLLPDINQSVMVKNLDATHLGFSPFQTGLYQLEDLLLHHINREGLSDDPDLPLRKAQGVIKFDPRSAIFVCNKWDQVKPAEREQVKDHVKMKLKKVWRGFDFESQVFFISATEIIKELNSGFVSREYRRLLAGIQNLLPVGFRSKIESQFWKMYNIMDRSTWILKHYIVLNNRGVKQDREVKQIRYDDAQKRLSQIKNRPAEARVKMQDVLNEEVETAILGIRSYMETKEVQDRLLNWKDADCPINENFNRLKQLQHALVERRIRTEIYNFEEQKNLFENIQKKILQKFKSIFVSVESEFAEIENGMKDEHQLASIMGDFVAGGTEFAFKFARNNHSFLDGRETRHPLLAKFEAVINAFALPVFIQRSRRRRTEAKEMTHYQQNKSQVMAQITKQVVDDLVNSKKLRSVVEEKLYMLQQKFSMLLDRIPAMIEANKRMISQLKKQLNMQTDFSGYIDHFSDGLKLQNSMNYDYMCHVRSYDIDIDHIKKLSVVGEGSFAKVYKGHYHQKGGNVQVVAVKRFKESLSNDNVSDFLNEELNLSHIRSPHIVKYIGTCVKKVGMLIYPAMVQEFCSLTLDDIIYNADEYWGPSRLNKSDPERMALVQRAAKFSNEIAVGLAAMHRQGFLHRDLKPENILVATQDGKELIKLCDLGLSKREQDLTATKVGSPLYMAPEVQKYMKYDRSADMFSYGLIVWEIWYGSEIDMPLNDDLYQLWFSNAFRNTRQGFNPPPQDWQQLLTKCWQLDSKLRPSAQDCSDLFSKLY